MFLNITEVTYIREYKLRIRFNNGVVKDIDLKNELYGEIFEPLKKPEFFREVSVNPETNTIEWSNGADFAPEFLYEIESNVTNSAPYDNNEVLTEKEEMSAGITYYINECDERWEHS